MNLLDKVIFACGLQLEIESEVKSLEVSESGFAMVYRGYERCPGVLVYVRGKADFCGTFRLGRDEAVLIDNKEGFEPFIEDALSFIDGVFYGRAG